MTKFISYDPKSGRIGLMYDCSHEEIAFNVSPEYSYIEHDWPMGPSRVDLDTLTVVPGAVSTYTLEELKRIKLDSIKADRDLAIYSGFSWSGSSFDSDQTSQIRLLGAVTAAIEVYWRLADNTWRLLSPSDLIAVYSALVQHTQTQFTIFAELEILVNQATTVEALELITWPKQEG